MSGLLKVVIIAYKPSQIDLKTDEPVRIVLLDGNGQVTVWRDVLAGAHSLDITNAGVYGFTSEREATLAYDAGRTTILQGSGKDPWPDPPPAAPQGYNVASYQGAFREFLLSSGGGSQYKVVTRMKVVPATTQPAHAVASP